MNYSFAGFWPWYVAGPAIALVAVVLLLLRRSFGVSSSLDTLCSMAGAGRKLSYFTRDWKNDRWLLLFLLGSMIGGFIGIHVLGHEGPLQLSASTVESLGQSGLDFDGNYLPAALYDWSVLGNWRGWLLLVGGGLLIGFGTRYAGGCTSGHAISGMSNLQLPSLVATMGFFAGGLICTHFILPLLLKGLSS